jgi:superfamily II DNA or RNA helicase
VKLRNYQVEMVDAIRAQWASGQRRVLGVLPTGGGKTEVAVQIILEEASPANRVLVLVERKVLCQQWVHRLRRHGLRHIGILQGENSIALSAPVIVATAQSIRSRGVPEDVSLIVIDESHIWHESHDKVLASADDALVLGLTATPLRDGLGRRFDGFVVGATIKALIEAKYLVQPRYFAPADNAVEEALANVAVRGGDYATEELSQAMRSRAIIGDVVGTWQRRGGDRQTVVFCVDKVHAADLCAEFVAVGIAAEVVVDETNDEDRNRIFKQFNARDVRVLLSVGVLSIGFDSPIASCAILARPTMSTSLHIQQGGRVLRPFVGKADALILDHAGNTLVHGKLEDFEPPTDLSRIEQRTDKRSRRAPAEAWVCLHCNAINAISDDVCMECGAPRRRSSKLVVLDGELVSASVRVRRNETPAGPAPADVHAFYRMAMWYGREKQFKRAEAWAFYATQRRFKFNDDAARRLIRWGWRDEEPLAPDASASRWFFSDYQRSLIVSRYRQQKVPAHA